MSPSNPDIPRVPRFTSPRADGDTRETPGEREVEQDMNSLRFGPQTMVSIRIVRYVPKRFAFVSRDETTARWKDPMKLRLALTICTALAIAVLFAPPAHAQYNPNFVTLSATTATPGQPFDVTGGYFDAGSEVTVVFTSTPITLGLLVAGNDGVVTGRFNVPAGAELGAHTIRLVGTLRGVAVEVSSALQVVGAGQAGPAGGPAPAALPVTGSSSARTYTAAAAGLVVVGAALVGLARSRRREIIET